MGILKGYFEWRFRMGLINGDFKWGFQMGILNGIGFERGF